MKNLLFIFTLLVSFVSFGQTAAEYYSSGNDKAEAKDFYGAISDYNKAIELNPNKVNAYRNRGISKELIEDLNGACADWKTASSLGDTGAAKWVANQCN